MSDESPSGDAYQAPVLRELGSVGDLTETLAGTLGNDGGAFPNSYTS